MLNKCIYLLLLLIALSKPANAVPYWSNDWEGSAVADSHWAVESVDPGNLTDVTISATQQNSASKALRTFIKNPSQVAGIKRAEVRHLTNATVGQQYFYRFSVYLPDDTNESYPINQNDAVRLHNIIAQWHAVKDANENYRVPNLAFHIDDDGELQIRGANSDLAINTNDNSNLYSYLGLNHESEFSIPKNQWVTLEVSVFWDSSSTGNGFLDIWMDGTLIVEYTGPTCYNDAVGPYFKMGVYRPAYYRAEATIYYDNFQMVQNGVIVYAVKDTYVRGGSYADSNYGWQTTLAVKANTDPKWEREAFLNFDYDQFSNYDFDGGELHLKLNAAAVGANLLISSAGNSWAENTLTYNNVSAIQPFVSLTSVSTADVDLSAVIPDVELSAEHTLHLEMDVNNASVSIPSSESSTLLDQPMLFMEL